VTELDIEKLDRAAAAEDSAGVARRRSRVPVRTRLDFWLDLVLFMAFTVDYAFRFTGLSIHEWLGLGFGSALVVHLALHWDWMLKTTRGLLDKLAGRERLRWIVDLGLLLSMMLCVASGVLISRSALPTIGLHPKDDAFWRSLHTTTADIAVFLVALHVALNWRWILIVGRRTLSKGRTVKVVQS
jgi:hypothetical protein